MTAALEVTGAQLVLAVAGLAAALVVVWRWPGLVLGVTSALAVWTVAPWLSLVVFAVVAVGAVAWRLVSPGRRVCWPGVAWLARRPPLAILVVSAAVAGAGPDSVAPWAFVVLLAAAGWLALTWPAVTPEAPPAAGTLPGSAGRRRLTAAPPGGAPVAGEVVVRRSGPCPHCGGLLVAELRVPAEPEAIEDLVARAACRACGARLVGVVDPSRPAAGLVWLPLPDVDETAEGIA